MTNRHTCLASTGVLVRAAGFRQRFQPEESGNLLQAVQMPEEISEAHLRVGMYLEAPMPLLSVFCRRLTLVEPCRNTP